MAKSRLIKIYFVSATQIPCAAQVIAAPMMLGEVWCLGSMAECNDVIGGMAPQEE